MPELVRVGNAVRNGHSPTVSKSVVGQVQCTNGVALFQQAGEGITWKAIGLRVNLSGLDIRVPGLFMVRFPTAEKRRAYMWKMSTFFVHP